ncbi:MAG: hypothetical protein H6623_07220 [Bdellovibrionaceae bacterium]|nr:hypothetical protein [Pseudobdellovibrionaceae bacterium]
MSQEFYLFLHLISLFTVFIVLGGLTVYMLMGGSKTALSTARRPLAILHGVALTLAFISGFGLIAKMHYSFSSSLWLYGKLFCWLLLGAFPVLAYKQIPARWGNILLLIFVATLATYLVAFKPF